jgi:hypothetical protein
MSEGFTGYVGSEFIVGLMRGVLGRLAVLRRGRHAGRDCCAATGPTRTRSPATRAPTAPHSSARIPCVPRAAALASAATRTR